MRQLNKVILLIAIIFNIEAAEITKQEFNLMKEIKCPSCIGQSVADSNAEIAISIRNLIQTKLRQGESEAEIKNYLAEKYGQEILFDTPKTSKTILIWVFPILLCGTLSLIIYFPKRKTKMSDYYHKHEL